MGYYIYAWLDKANPQLQIVDAASGSISVSWSYQGTGGNALTDENEIKRLFRDLILLTCKQEINNSRVFTAAVVNESALRYQYSA